MWRVNAANETKSQTNSEVRVGTILKSKNPRKIWPILMAGSMMLASNIARAQDGVAGIEEANTKVRGYFDVGCNLMYAVGAILGLIGAVRVYQKWSNGQPDTGQVAAAWFGSCVFLVIVATVLKSFFGL